MLVLLQNCLLIAQFFVCLPCKSTSLLLAVSYWVLKNNFRVNLAEQCKEVYTEFDIFALLKSVSYFLS